MDQITKIYNLQTLGFDDRHKEFQTLTKDLEALRTAKLNLNKTAADVKNAIGQESDAYKKAAAAVADAKVKALQLIAAKKQLTNEIKAGQVAKQAEINQQKQVVFGNNAVAGSYAAVVAQMKQ